MASFNKVELLGTLTCDPVKRTSADGEELCCFGISVTQQVINQNETLVNETCYADVEAPGKVGELALQFFHKGSPVFIDGRLRYESWTDRASGRRRSKLVVVATGLLSVKPDGSPLPEPPPPVDYGQAQPQWQQQPQQWQPPQWQQQPPQPSPPQRQEKPLEQFDDPSSFDMPF